MLRVLFIFSGNSINGIGAVVSNQANSISKQGVYIHYFPIRGKGLYSYIKQAFLLRKHLRKNTFDIIHAHYSLSAFAATLAGSKPLIVSLMGSDARAGGLISLFIRYLYKTHWRELIVKSPSMAKQLRLKNSHIIPNGVDLSFFRPINDSGLKTKFGFSEKKKTLLFLADPDRESKNFTLAKQAFDVLSPEVGELKVRFNLPKEEIPEIINAADIILLTSLWEGSPNVIKEAMACNKPIVATNVGDIAWLFGNEPGHFLTSFDPEDVAAKLKLALEFSEKHQNSNGRQRIIELGLSSEMVSQKIISIYNSVLNVAK